MKISTNLFLWVAGRTITTYRVCGGGASGLTRPRMARRSRGQKARERTIILDLRRTLQARNRLESICKKVLL